MQTRLRSFGTARLAVLSVLAWAVAAQAEPPLVKDDDCTKAGCHDNRTKCSTVHDPAGEGSCDACHELVNEREHTFRFLHLGKALCEDCHDDVTEEHTFAHGPCAGGACTVCHDPHASDHPKMLVADQPELCVRCHNSVAACLAGCPHTHKPANKECLSCHHPHGAEDRMMLLKSRPGLCLSCHDELAGTVEASSVRHGAVACNRSCTNCHHPHASSMEHNLRGEPSALCLSCHDKELPSAHGKVPNIAKLLKECAYHHGPIKDRKCAPCHAHVHGGGDFRLLCRQYPPEFYTSFAESQYALCFGCHDAKAMAKEHTKSLTKFRNGDRNLHYLHVNRDTKGRSCRACHNSHASDNPKHIATSVRFGAMQWELPLNCELSATGGSCAPGCHKPYRYDRESPVQNLPPLS